MNKFKLSDISQKIINSFNHLPYDEYIKGNFNYRRRRYHSGVIVNRKITWDDNPELFIQSASINQYSGGIERKYASVNTAITDFIGEVILQNIHGHILNNSDYKIGLHQIRICADENNMGKPAPEGIHQDGFDFVCVYCVNLNNTSGGESLLVDANDHASLLHDVTLFPGEVLLFDDKKFAHYVSPITPKLPGIASRDVFVITFKKLTVN